MDKRKIKINQEELRKGLDYCPIYGTFTWITNPSRPVGYYNGAGIRIIQVYGKKFKATELLYLWMTGKWPDDEIVHYDANLQNFKWDNLEKRKKLGFKPLLFTKLYKGKVKHTYSILAGKSRVYGGSFDTRYEAIDNLVQSVRSLRI